MTKNVNVKRVKTNPKKKSQKPLLESKKSRFNNLPNVDLIMHSTNIKHTSTIARKTYTNKSIKSL